MIPDVLLSGIRELPRWCPCALELVEKICPGCGIALGPECLRTHVCIPRRLNRVRA